MSIKEEVLEWERKMGMTDRVSATLLNHIAKQNDISLGGDEVPQTWTFEDSAVAEKFDQHVREQLPWYDPLSRFVADVAVSFLPSYGVLYDIGASTGNITKLMRQSIIEKNVRAISIEPAHAMSELWEGEGELHIIDAQSYNFEEHRPDVAIMFLALMFMPPSERMGFMRRLLSALQPGGAILVVDKGYIGLPAAQVACKAATVAEKMRQGCAGESYVVKELSLRGEQRPTDDIAIFDLAIQHNFGIEEIFRFGEFYGLLLVKNTI